MVPVTCGAAEPDAPPAAATPVIGAADGTLVPVRTDLGPRRRLRRTRAANLLHHRAVFMGRSVLYVAIELVDPIFSGNGVLSRAHVRALLAHGYSVRVVCAAPGSADTTGSAATAALRAAVGLDIGRKEHAASDAAAPSPLPDGHPASRTDPSLDGYIVAVSRWYRTDRHGPWREFATAAAKSGALHAALRAWLLQGPDVCMYVDWTAATAARCLLAALDTGRSSQEGSLHRAIAPGLSVETAASRGTDPDVRIASWAVTSIRRPVPVVAHCFCLFHMAHHASQGDALPDDAAFYRALEHRVYGDADHVTVLCREDARMLRALLMSPDVVMCDDGASTDHSRCRDSGQPRCSPAISVLLPSLRPDISQLAADRADDAGRRCYLSCCVRLHPHKRVDLFVESCGLLAKTLRMHGIRPLLCGAASDELYAAECRTRLLSLVPEATVMTEFLAAAGLCAIFRQTCLNVHPAPYEAYGMTIVESAAMGAPSLVDRDGRIGATDLLTISDGVRQRSVGGWHARSC